jgi:hypothetical protein
VNALQPATSAIAALPAAFPAEVSSIHIPRREDYLALVMIPVRPAA